MIVWLIGVGLGKTHCLGLAISFAGLYIGSLSATHILSGYAHEYAWRAVLADVFWWIMIAFVLSSLGRIVVYTYSSCLNLYLIYV